MVWNIGRRTLLSVTGLALLSGCLDSGNTGETNDHPQMTFAWGHHLGDSDTVDLWHEIGEPVQAGLLRFSGTIEEDGQTWADVAGVPADEAVEEGDEVELMPLYDNAVTIAIRWEGDPDDPVELSNRSVSVGNP